MNSEDRVRHASKRRMRSRLGVGRAHPTGKKFGGSMKKLATWFLHVIVPSAPAVHLSLFLVPPILAMGSSAGRKSCCSCLACPGGKDNT